MQPIGVVRSRLRRVADAPNQAEGAPDAVVKIDPRFGEALHRIEVGDELIVLAWLHLADRTSSRLTRWEIPASRSPASLERAHLTGPTRIGVDRGTVTALDGPTTLRVDAVEAIDGTPGRRRQGRAGYPIAACSGFARRPESNGTNAAGAPPEAPAGVASFRSSPSGRTHTPTGRGCPCARPLHPSVRASPFTGKTFQSWQP
jgi:tRNA (Thr-GGU) A37 N-methylase